MTGKARNVQVYLSPHLDDAALSCGGRIWQQARERGAVKVITVFAGAPDSEQPLSPFAGQLHTRWGTPTDALEVRRREDRDAVGYLGAAAVHWPYRDCIYRRTMEGHFAYPDEEALWGSIDPADMSLIRILRDRIATLALESSARFYVGLAAGGHVDHRIVRSAAEESGVCLTFYEDFPYAEHAESLTTALGGGAWCAQTVPLSDDALERKIAAIARYRTQVSTFWGSLGEMAESVRAYAEQVGGGTPAERYWSVSSA